MKLIPTVFAKNKKDFDLKFREIVKTNKEIQIDFMDGIFVKSKSIELKDLPNLKKYKNKFEAHLMVKDPGNWIYDLKEKGFYKVLFHYESVKDLDEINRLVFLAKSEKMEAWIVFNPETDFNKVFEVFNKIHSGISGIMFMGHTSGIEGKPLDINVVRRVRNFKRIYKKIRIQIDGGINDKNIKDLNIVGVDIINVGSFVSKARDPKKALELLKKRFN